MSASIAWFLFGLALGWIIGVANSYRQIRRERQHQAQAAQRVTDSLNNLLVLLDDHEIVVTFKDEQPNPTMVVGGATKH